VQKAFDIRYQYGGGGGGGGGEGVR